MPAGREHAAVWTEGDGPAEDIGVVDVQRRDARPPGHIPDLCVSSPRLEVPIDNERDEGLGRAEGDIAGVAAVSDAAERGAGRDVPERHAVPAGRGEHRPVRADAHADGIRGDRKRSLPERS